MMVTLVVCAA